MADRFLKLMVTDEAQQLLEKEPNCFLLITQIAMRAKRTNSFSAKGLTIGQALIGDHSSIGLTEQEYRTAKQKLETWRFSTFKGTNKGTIATLLDTRIYDINKEGDNEQDNEWITNKQRTNNEQTTTNKNERKKECKNGKNKIDISNDMSSNSDSSESDKPVSFNRKTGEFEGLTPDRMQKLQTIAPSVDLSLEIEKMKLWLTDNPNGKRRKGNWTFIIRWISKSSDTQKYNEQKTQKSPDKETAFKEKVKTYFPKGSIHNGALADWDEYRFGLRRGQKDQTIQWNDSNFKNKFDDLVKSFGIEIYENKQHRTKIERPDFEAKTEVNDIINNLAEKMRM